MSENHYCYRYTNLNRLATLTTEKQLEKRYFLRRSFVYASYIPVVVYVSNKVKNKQDFQLYTTVLLLTAQQVPILRSSIKALKYFIILAYLNHRSHCCIIVGLRNYKSRIKNNRRKRWRCWRSLLRL